MEPAPPPFYEGGKGGGGVGFRGVQIFPIKREMLVKQGSCFIKGQVSLIYVLTNPFQCYLSECLVCMCVFCLFTPFSSVLLVFSVSWEELTLIKSNQKIHDFYKWVTFRSKDIVESTFLILASYSSWLVRGFIPPFSRSTPPFPRFPPF